MTATPIVGAALAFLAMALAGCTGGFQVDQTEPFRVQLEGAPETVTVRESDTEAKRVVVETCGEEVDACDVEQVEVQLMVKQVASGPCSILVTIQDEDGMTITSRVIEVTGAAGNATNGTSPATNGTGNETMTSQADASGQTVIQNIVVNVRGHRNVVVVTQAQEGSADISVQAIDASGNAEVGGEEPTTTVTNTTSATMTTSASGNTTTGP